MVTIIASIACISVIAVFVTFFLIEPEFLESSRIFYFLAVIAVLFIASESYSSWFFKKMELENKSHLNTSLLVFKKHYDLCKKETD